MISFNFGVSLVLLLLGFILGLCASLLFTCNKSSGASKVPVAVSKAIKEVNNIDVAYQNTLDSLRVENEVLQEKLDVTAGQLSDAKQTSLQSERKLQAIILQYKSKKKVDQKLVDVVVKQSPEKDKQKLKEGYVALFDGGNECDSLAGEVQDYIAENHRKDSIYELQLSQFDSVITLKDGIIQADSKAYNSLYSAVQKLNTDVSKLAKENKSLKRQVAGQKIKSKFLTATLLALSGYTTNYILRH